MRQQVTDVDMIDLFEQMLYQRATKGFRPVLYVSSHTDFECNLLMLLDEEARGYVTGQQSQAAKETGYHVVKN